MAKDKPKRVLEAASDAAGVAAIVTEMGATGGFISGGKLLWHAVDAGIKRRRRREAEAYLDRIAAALGSEDTARLATELQNDHLDHAWDIIEEGYRVMMSALHEDAKQAISALVADYVKLQSQPDREYQLVGELLSRSDHHLLKIFLVITDELAEVSALRSSKYPNMIVRGYNLVRGPGAGEQGDIWMCCHLKADDGQLTISSTGSPLPKKLNVALRLLDRFEFGSLPNPKARLASGYTTELHPAIHDVMFHTAPTMEERLNRLRGYLRYALKE